MNERKKSKILVVDDEPGWRDLLALELSAGDYCVKTVPNALEALDFLRKEPFDLVITDVRMPGGLDGIDLIETHRQQNPTQKAIFVTGYAIEEKIEQALQKAQGLTLCLRKPFETQDLFKALQFLLAS